MGYCLPCVHGWSLCLCQVPKGRGWVYVCLGDHTRDPVPFISIPVPPLSLWSRHSSHSSTRASGHPSPSSSIDLAPHHMVLHTAVCVVISLDMVAGPQISGQKEEGRGLEVKQGPSLALMFGLEVEREVEQQWSVVWTVVAAVDYVALYGRWWPEAVHNV